MRISLCNRFILSGLWWNQGSKGIISWKTVSIFPIPSFCFIQHPDLQLVYAKQYHRKMCEWKNKDRHAV